MDTLIQGENQKACCSIPETNRVTPLLKSLASAWEGYKPLIIIFSFCLILSVVQSGVAAHSLMRLFMGYFLIFLSLFKFFDLKGFVDGFATYDLMTKQMRAYGYTYPFIEFSLGIAYVANYEPLIINWITVVVMTLSGAGVLNSVLSGQKLKCVCLGTVLNVPLSTVSVLENFGMATMAAYNLICI